MAGSYPVLQLGPATYAVNVTVAGGQLVEPDSTTKKVKPATAASKAVLGMAMTDASPAGSGSNLSFATNPPTVAVAYGPAEVLLTTTADIAFGGLCIAGAAGTVSPIASGTFDQVVAKCTDPNGVLSGATGRFRLMV